MTTTVSCLSLTSVYVSSSLFPKISTLLVDQEARVLFFSLSLSLKGKWVRVSACNCVRLVYECSSWEGQKRASDAPELALQSVVSCLMWVLETELYPLQ